MNESKETYPARLNKSARRSYWKGGSFGSVLQLGGSAAIVVLPPADHADKRYSRLEASASSTFNCARRTCKSIAFSFILSERSIRSHKLLASATKSLTILLMSLWAAIR